MESTTTGGGLSTARDRGRGWVEVLARLGYAAKGIVYLAVGGLSARAAVVTGGDVTSSREALRQLAGGPFGRTVMVCMAVGLVGYVTWRLVQALLDPEGEGSDAKGLARRGALLVSAAVHAGLALWVIRALTGGGGGGGAASGGAAESWSQRLLAQPWGAWLLAAVGIAVIAYGVIELVKAHRRTWERRLRRDLSGKARRWAGRAARFGLVARGVVFLVIGGFVVHTALTSDPAEARGMEGALATVGNQPYGSWLLAAVALGLAAYGLFQCVKAWYRRFGPIGDP